MKKLNKKTKDIVGGIIVGIAGLALYVSMGFSYENSLAEQRKLAVQEITKAGLIECVDEVDYLDRRLVVDSQQIGAQDERLLYYGDIILMNDPMWMIIKSDGLYKVEGVETRVAAAGNAVTYYVLLDDFSLEKICDK